MTPPQSAGVRGSIQGLAPETRLHILEYLESRKDIHAFVRTCQRFFLVGSSVMFFPNFCRPLPSPLRQFYSLAMYASPQPFSNRCQNDVPAGIPVLYLATSICIVRSIPSGGLLTMKFSPSKVPALFDSPHHGRKTSKLSALKSLNGAKSFSSGTDTPTIILNFHDQATIGQF